MEHLTSQLEQARQTPSATPVSSAQISIQQALVECRKKERSLDRKVTE